MSVFRVLRITVVVALCAFATAVQAMPVLQGTPGAATGFLNLDIGGELYNATFHADASFPTLYPPPFDDGIDDAIWWDEPAIAQTVGDAILMALADNSVTGIDGYVPFIPGQAVAAFGLPTGTRPAGFGSFIVEGYLGVLGPNPGDTWVGTNSDVGTFGGTGFFANVTLERSTVSSASPVWLMSSGLIVLALVRRRRKGQC